MQHVTGCPHSGPRRLNDGGGCSATHTTQHVAPTRWCPAARPHFPLLWGMTGGTLPPPPPPPPPYAPLLCGMLCAVLTVPCRTPCRLALFRVRKDWLLSPPSSCHGRPGTLDREGGGLASAFKPCFQLRQGFPLWTCAPWHRHNKERWVFGQWSKREIFLRGYQAPAPRCCSIWPHWGLSTGRAAHPKAQSTPAPDELMALSSAENGPGPACVFSTKKTDKRGSLSSPVQFGPWTTCHSSKLSH